MLRFIFLIAFSAMAYRSSAQVYSISGKVAEKEEKTVLVGAGVILTQLKDSSKLVTTSTTTGNFIFQKMKPGNYQLRITYIGFKAFEQTLSVERENIELGTITLEEDIKELEQVKVKGQIPLAEQQGDTTQYNANAYKTHPDATAEELIQKMPGVVVQNGKVQAQGEDVKEVLVDGKPFFGNDPMAALRNLPAEVIDKIQVFDRQSEQAQFTGFEDGQTSKTLNIITKANMRNGQFGKAYAGYGYDNKYQAGGNVNIFDGDTRLSIIGQTNNVNNQNFSTEDLLGVVGSNGGNRRRGGRGGGSGGRGGGGRGGFRGGGNGGDVNDFLVGQQEGITTTHAFGLNYTDNWANNVEVTGSYFFNMSDNSANQRLNRSYVLPGNQGQTYDEVDESNSQNINHRFNLRLDYKINDNNSLLIRPSLSIQENNGGSYTLGQTYQQGTLLNQTDNLFQSDLSGINFSNRLLFRHQFEKRGRTFSVNVNTGYNKNTGESQLLSENQYFEETIFTDSLNQFADLLADGWSISGNIMYTEPLGKSGMAQINYSTSFQQNASDKYTFNFSENTQDYTDIDTLLTNVFSSNYITHQAGLGYRFNTQDRKLMFMTRMGLQWALLDSEETLPDAGSIQRDFVNVLPMAFARYQFSRTKNLRLIYRTSTTSPTINQLQNVVDNSNPLQLSMGNPALEQAYQHQWFLRYGSTNIEKSNVFFAMLGGQFAQDYIGNSTVIAEKDTTIADGFVLPAGAQLSRPVNLDGYWNLRSYVAYGMPLGFLKSNLNMDASATYSRIPGIINDALGFTNNYTLGTGLVLSSNISENVDFTLSARPSYNWAFNTIQEDLNTDYLNLNSSARINLIFWKGLVFRTELTHQFYNGLSEGYDQNYFLWNASIGKKLFKSQLGEIKLSVFDILKENTSVQRTVSDAYVEDVQTQVLQQYYMLTFTYNLRNFKVGEEG